MISVADLTAALHEAMHAHCKAGDFDLETDPETGAIEVTTDDWTLSIDGLPDEAIAFLAVDSEPDEESEYVHALKDAVRPNELQALAAADVAVQGAISASLNASGDPFSQHLANAISVTGID